MSSRTRAPKHQNTYAFEHNTNSRKTAKILAMPNVGLCKRCHDIIEWRKRYRKYKPLTKPHKCNACALPKVKAAYHHLCQECAHERNVCPKCMANKEIFGLEEAELAELKEQIAFLEDTKGQIPGMTEREKRALIRDLYRQIKGVGAAEGASKRGAGADGDSEGDFEGDDDLAAGDEEDGAVDAADAEDDDDAAAAEDDDEDDETGAAEMAKRPMQSYEDMMAHSDAVGSILTKALKDAKIKAAAMGSGRVDAKAVAKAAVKAAFENPAAAVEEEEEDTGPDPWEVQERLRKLVVTPKPLPKKADA